MTLDDFITDLAEWEDSVFWKLHEPSSGDIDGGSTLDETSGGFDLLDKWLSVEVVFLSRAILENNIDSLLDGGLEGR